MKKDIIHPKVEDIGIAAVLEKNDANVEEWTVYIINFKDVAIDNVLVASKGYGLQKGEQKKTSILRHFFEEIQPKTAVRVEMILDELLGLSNEYWVSFYVGMTIFDKKYVFLAESLKEENFSSIPVLEKQGVLIR